MSPKMRFPGQDDCTGGQRGHHQLTTQPRTSIFPSLAGGDASDGGRPPGRCGLTFRGEGQGPESLLSWALGRTWKLHPWQHGTVRDCPLRGQRLPSPECWVWAQGWDASFRVVIVHCESVCFCPGLRTGHTELSDEGWSLSQLPSQGSVPGPSPYRELVGQQRAAGSGSRRPGGGRPRPWADEVFVSQPRAPGLGRTCL